jgi:SAM-dependent methyltransferase
MPHAHNLDLPEWDGQYGLLPYGDGRVDAIYAFHFFEHLSGAQAITMLRECERVLRFGGILTTVTPHRLGSMAFHDLDHKSFWSEDTWKTLLGTPWYDKNREVPWKLRLGFNMIAGLNERNLCLMSQLVKGD